MFATLFGNDYFPARWRSLYLKDLLPFNSPPVGVVKFLLLGSPQLASLIPQSAFLVAKLSRAFPLPSVLIFFLTNLWFFLVLLVLSQFSSLQNDTLSSAFEIGCMPSSWLCSSSTTFFACYYLLPSKGSMIRNIRSRTAGLFTLHGIIRNIKWYTYWLYDGCTAINTLPLHRIFRLWFNSSYRYTCLRPLLPYKTPGREGRA